MTILKGSMSIGLTHGEALSLRPEPDPNDRNHYFCHGMLNLAFLEQETDPPRVWLVAGCTACGAQLQLRVGLRDPENRIRIW